MTGSDDTAGGDLPSSVIDEAERLTRLARDAIDERERAAYRTRRDDRLAEFGFEARVREEETRDVLVLHPTEWIDEGLVRVENVEDRSRAVEIPLGGPGDPDDWSAVDAHNREVVERVRRQYGDVHAENADAFADFMGNHYARPVESAGREEIEEFLSEYFVRNAWPTATQRSVVEKSIRLVFESVDEPVPPFSSCSR